MSITIMEALENADYNLTHNMNSLGMAAVHLAQQQLHIAVGLLGKGYSLYDEAYPLLDTHGGIDGTPEKNP